jgi:hypothetical protein
MRRIIPFALVAALAGSACGLFGPSKSVAGAWRAAGIGHSGHYFELTLTQSGDDVSGVVCSSDGGFLLYEGVPVSGELPTVTFVAPFTGGRFAGKFEEDRDQIAGDLAVGTGHIPLRFVRSEGGKCAGAKPLPQR